MKKDAAVLDLCSGDGFYSRHFYSAKAKRIVALDFDEAAVKHANKYNKAPNIEYLLSDIRINIPEGKFDNIFWDAGIAHFTTDEMKFILNVIKNRSSDDGILSGYTIVEKESGMKSLKQHKYEFKTKEELKLFLEPYFNNIKVFETIYPDRTNLYFWASDGILPFDISWEHLTETKKMNDPDPVENLGKALFS